MKMKIYACAISHALALCFTTAVMGSTVRFSNFAEKEGIRARIQKYIKQLLPIGSSLVSREFRNCILTFVPHLIAKTWQKQGGNFF